MQSKVADLISELFKEKNDEGRYRVDLIVKSAYEKTDHAERLRTVRLALKARTALAQSDALRQNTNIRPLAILGC